MRVTVVIPAHNEAHCLDRNVGELLAFIGGLAGGDDYDVVIAENGSTDGTAAIAEEVARAHDLVRAISTFPAGRGRALRAAWLGTDADIVGYMDADLATGLDALPLAIAAIRSGADIAVGTRHAADASVRRSFGRGLLSRGYNLLLKTSFGLSLTDGQCGFKFLTAAAARRIVPQIENDRWFFDTELLVRAAADGLRIAEVPVSWRQGGRSTVRIVPTIIEEAAGLVRLRAGMKR
jgi:glycosyltransferase involved in cell wall biosynthesis